MCNKSHDWRVVHPDSSGVLSIVDEGRSIGIATLQIENGRVLSCRIRNNGRNPVLHLCVWKAGPRGPIHQERRGFLSVPIRDAAKLEIDDVPGTERARMAYGGHGIQFLKQYENGVRRAIAEAVWSVRRPDGAFFYA